MQEQAKWVLKTSANGRALQLAKCSSCPPQSIASYDTKLFPSSSQHIHSHRAAITLGDTPHTKSNGRSQHYIRRAIDLVGRRGGNLQAKVVLCWRQRSRQLSHSRSEEGWKSQCCPCAPPAQSDFSRQAYSCGAPCCHWQNY